MDKYTGKKLDKRYEIQELIGIGGMATVYKAYDSIDDKTVAIKILKDEYLGNEDFIRRFKNESKAIAVLSHNNIVKVYDVSFGERIQYIVMEYVDGITLKEYIGQQKVVPWKEAVHFTVQILQALQHAHEKGIIHRDIKPQNIMLLQDGSIKVMDFGIAKLAYSESHTKTDKTIGSVHYIAPEQVKGKVADGKADIYSVGVMLYEMLTGKLPFDGDTAVSVALMQVQNEPTPPRELNEKIPAGLEEITLKAMRKDPAQRFAGAGEMLEAIETFRRDPSVTFGYKYFDDKAPTKYVDSISSVRTAVPEPAYNDNYDSNDDDDDDDIVISRTKTAVKWLTISITLLVIVAIAVLVLNLWQSAVKSNEIPSVDVPNFVGHMIDEVKKDRNYKFEFEITAKYDDSQPLNVVLSQEPEAGTKQIKENAVVKLTVNSTSTITEVPKLKNYLEQEAIDKLKTKYLNYDVQRVNSTEVPKGYIIDCAPQEGTEQEIGTTITLIVSDGPVPEQVEVPDVSGKSYDTAKANLEALGFTTQKETVASAVEAGKVISTDPLPGNKLTKGSLISIRVSDGSKIINSLEYQVDLPTEEYAEITVTVYVDGKKFLEETGSPATGYKMELEIEPEGAVKDKKEVTIMVDGVRYEVLSFDFKNQTVTRSYINTNYKIKEGAPNEDLSEYMETAIQELRDYIQLDDYSEENQHAITAVLSEYYAKIYEATSQEDIDALVEETKAELDKIEPESGNSEVDLDTMISNAITSLQVYVNTDDLSDADVEHIEYIVSAYSNSIRGAQSAAEIDDLVSRAKSEMDEVVQNAGENSEDESSEEENEE